MSGGIALALLCGPPDGNPSHGRASLGLAILTPYTDLTSFQCSHCSTLIPDVDTLKGGGGGHHSPHRVWKRAYAFLGAPRNFLYHVLDDTHRSARSGMPYS